MKIPILFGCFLLGLLAGTSPRISEPAWFHFPLLILSLIPVYIPKIPRNTYIVFIGIASFFLGVIWITQLPTWPHAFDTTDNAPGNEISVIGIATGSEFECPNGRFMPLSLEKIRVEDCPWENAGGIVLATVPNDFISLPGARYEIHGVPDSNPDALHSPLILRYRARAIIRPSSSGICVHKIRQPGMLADFMNRIRYQLMSHLSWGIGLRESELVTGITFGRKGRRFTGNWAGDFYRAGLSHLIVASGAQVSLLFLPILFVLTRIRMPKILRFALLTLLTLVLFGFAQLLGGEPSILRAAVMGAILLLSIGIDRQTFGLATLSVAGWYWLIANPLLIRDIGFLLSFAACFGIIYLSPPLFGRFLGKNPTLHLSPDFSSASKITEIFLYSLRWLLHLLKGLSVITFSAQIGVVPILACTIGRLSVSGFIANLFAVPIAQIILYLGALSGAGGFVSPVICMKINHILGYLAIILLKVAHDFASIPHANMPIDPLPASFGIIWYLFLILIVEYWRIGYYISLKRKMLREMKNGRHKNRITKSTAKPDYSPPLTSA